MRTRWEEILCSFFQFLIVIRLLRASWEELFQACALTEGLKLVYFTPLCKGLSTLSCWVSVISLTLLSLMQILQRDECSVAASVYLYAGFCCSSWKCQCSSAIKKIIQMRQRQMNSSLKKQQANKKKTNKTPAKDIELWECCSYCKRSNFKAILL